MKRTHSDMVSTTFLSPLESERGDAIPPTQPEVGGSSILLDDLANLDQFPLFGEKAVKYIMKHMHRQVCVIISNIPGDPGEGWVYNKRTANIVCKLMPTEINYTRLRITGYIALEGYSPREWQFFTTIDALLGRPIYGVDTTYTVGDPLQVKFDMINIFGINLFSD